MTGFVLQRLRAHRLLVAAALLTSLLVTTVLASLAAYAHTTGDAGVRRALEHQAAPRTVLTARTKVTARNRASADEGVRAAARNVFGGLPVATTAVTRSHSYALPRSLRPAGERAGGEEERPDLTVFASLDPDRVTVVHGRWPQAPAAAGSALQAAVPERVARRLDLHVGDELHLTSRLSDPPVDARVTAVYRPRDREAPYWRLDPLGGDAVRTLDYTTYGPLAVDDHAFDDPSLPPYETHWLADADFSTLPASRLTELHDHAAHAVKVFSKAPHTAGAVAQSELPDLLAGLRRSLLTSRSTLLVAALQLVCLAVLALLLVARLLTSERTDETATLRARGASRTRLTAFSALEALLVALPGAVLGPLLALPVVRLLLTRGALGRAGVTADAELTATVWWVAAAAALACALTVVAPSLRRGSASLATRRARRTSALLRGGGDLAVLVPAVVAVWQLRRRSSGAGVLTTGRAGPDGPALGLDPVLVTAPALALLAGTVLALRLLPLVARLGERRAARGRGLAPALAGWQLARRPGYGAGPTLLLVLAVAMAVLAVGQSASWDRSQTDQAAFSTGADIAATTSTAPPFGQGGVYDDVDGVTGVAPVARDAFTVHGERVTQVVATDTRAAAGILHPRGDLTDEPLPELLEPLAGHRLPDRTGVPLPEDTRTLRFTLRLDAPAGTPVSTSGTVEVAVTVRDRYGVPYTFQLGSLRGDGARHTLGLDLAEYAGGTDSRPGGPLVLTGMSLSYQAPGAAADTRFTLTALEAGTPGGTTRVRLPDGRRWHARAHLERTPQPGTRDYLRGKPSVTAVGTAPGDGLLRLRYSTGSALEPVPWQIPPVPVRIDLSYAPAHATAPAPLTAVGTDAFLSAVGAHVGDSVEVQIFGSTLTIRLTGSMHALPTTETHDPATDGGALLLDLGALDRALMEDRSPPLEPESWWLSTDPRHTEDVAHALRADPAVDTVLVRDERARDLRSDPLTAAPRTALTAIALAAAVLAGMGCAVSMAGAARERGAEFGILRALGASARQPARVLAAEQGVLLALAVGVGLLLGWLSTRLVLPLIVLTAEATRPVPQLLVHLPSGELAAMLCAVLALPVLVAAATALRRVEPTTALRTERGE